MNEERFLEEAGITVTRTLLTTPSKSVSIANIASVSKHVQVTETQVPKNRTAAIILIVAGIVTLWLLIGVIPLIIGIILLNRKETTRSTLFEVQLESSGASSTAFESPSEELVDRIVAAVRAAIAARG